jgi:hypothetical protein
MSKTDNVSVISAANKIADVMEGIQELFSLGCAIDKIKIGLDEIVGMVFTVTVSPASLGESNFSDTDFRLFCERNDLNGVIFFNKNGSATFSMTPKQEPKKETIPVFLDGKLQNAPKPSEKVLDFVARNEKLKAIKLFREENISDPIWGTLRGSKAVVDNWLSRL